MTTWNIITTNGTRVTTSEVETERPHFAAMQRLYELSSSSRTPEQGIVALSATRQCTIDTLAEPAEAFMSVDYHELSERLSGKSTTIRALPGIPVAHFLAERTLKGSMRHELMEENMPWLECFMPSDLLTMFPLIDDDGSLEQHIQDMILLANAIADDAEAALASPGLTMPGRKRAMLQLQMAAYLSMRPRVLLSLLLSGIMPKGCTSHVMTEFNHSVLELY